MSQYNNVFVNVPQ